MRCSGALVEAHGRARFGRADHLGVVVVGGRGGAGGVDLGRGRGGRVLDVGDRVGTRRDVAGVVVDRGAQVGGRVGRHRRGDPGAGVEGGGRARAQRGAGAGGVVVDASPSRPASAPEPLTSGLLSFAGEAGVVELIVGSGGGGRVFDVGQRRRAGRDVAGGIGGRGAQVGGRVGRHRRCDPGAGVEGGGRARAQRGPGAGGVVIDASPSSRPRRPSP